MADFALPISEQLRYLIPFRPPGEIAQHLRDIRAAGHQLAVLGDDGEKFGGWPGTREWLYDKGWMNAFLVTMRELRDSGEVTFSRFDDARSSTSSGGIAYLPSASYREMEGWSLPRPRACAPPARAGWDGSRIEGVDGGLLRGSHWRNFMVKYPESNRLHKAVAAVSALARRRGDPVNVRRWLGRAQCNDAYWHGVFGGLYLPFLRAPLWRNLARAEQALRDGEAIELERVDFDADGHEEIWVHSAGLSALVAPARGGSVEMLLDFQSGDNVADTLTRYREAYHEPLHVGRDGAAAHAGPEGGAPSIHDLEGQLTELPIDDEVRALWSTRSCAVNNNALTSLRIGAGGASWARTPMTADARDRRQGRDPDARRGLAKRSASAPMEPSRATGRGKPPLTRHRSGRVRDRMSVARRSMSGPGRRKVGHSIDTVPERARLRPLRQGTALIYAGR